MVRSAVDWLDLAAEDLRCAGAALPGGSEGRRDGCGRDGSGPPAGGGRAGAGRRRPGVQAPGRAVIEFRLLGRFRVSRAGRDIASSSFGGRQARQLVQILLRERGRLVPRDVLVAALWPEREPADPGANLAVLASRARHALGDSSLIVVSERAPLHEEGQLLVMRAHAEAGDPAAAIELFHAWRRRLADELGLDPCAEMSELYGRVIGCGPASGPIRPAEGTPGSSGPAAGGPARQGEMPEPAWEILGWISDAAFVLDPGGRLLYVNRRAAELAGRPPAASSAGRSARFSPRSGRRGSAPVPRPR